jgi:hypothetical protein
MDEKTSDETKTPPKSQLPSLMEIKEIMDLGQPTVLAVDFDHDVEQYRETLSKLEIKGQDAFDVHDEMAQCIQMYTKYYHDEMSIRKKMKSIVSEIVVTNREAST